MGIRISNLKEKLMGRPKKVEEVVEVVEEVTEAPKQPDINNPEDGNKTYAEINA